jgi:hypothetical protein
VGIDDIHIFDKDSIYTGAPVTTNAQPVSDSNWIGFNSGGNIYAAMNPNGMNLGMTNAQVYPYTSGSVNNNGAQYFINRNIVIQPLNPPSGNVTVRFYFTDSEVNKILTDQSCLTCTKITDAYRLGVIKYSGTVADENGTLADDINGVFTFIPRDSLLIIPNNNGYYAEFSVNSFSEFWLSASGLSNNNIPLPLDLINFSATKSGVSKALLVWTVTNQLNNYKYVIQRSIDGTNYNDIGYTFVQINGDTDSYNFIDSLPFDGVNYYRLQIVARDGVVTYSPIRKVDFASATDEIFVYPNPVSVNSSLFISSSGICTNAVLMDASGRIINNYMLQGNNNSISFAGIAKGIYFLKIFTETTVATEKISVQ